MGLPHPGGRLSQIMEDISDKWEEQWLIPHSKMRKVFNVLEGRLDYGSDGYEPDMSKFILFVRGSRDRLDEIRPYLKKHGRLLKKGSKW